MYIEYLEDVVSPYLEQNGGGPQGSHQHFLPGGGRFFLISKKTNLLQQLGFITKEQSDL